MLYAAIIGRKFFFDENHSLGSKWYGMTQVLRIGIWKQDFFVQYGAPVINGPAKGAAETGD